MISMLQGKIVEKNIESVIVDAAGVGYEVFIPTGVLLELGTVGEYVRLRTHLEVREDALLLYGFNSREQLEMFRLLISVGKIGPRTALSVLSVMDVPNVVEAINGQDVKAFTSVPGIGKKTAQRIFLDIGEKVRKRWGAIDGGGVELSVGAGPAGGVWETARAALLAQSFRPSEAEERLAWARGQLGEDAAIENILKEALRFQR